MVIAMNIMAHINSLLIAFIVFLLMLLISLTKKLVSLHLYKRAILLFIAWPWATVFRSRDTNSSHHR